MNNLPYLVPIAQADIAFIEEREKTYQGSWKKSGGRSAYFQIKRKMDRLTNLMQRPPDCISVSDLDDAIDGLKDEADVTLAVAVVRGLRNAYTAEDVFAKIEDDASGDDGTVLAEIRDLRRYLLLIESEMVARGIVAHPAEAGGHPARALNGAKHDATNLRSVLYQGDPRRDDPPGSGTPADGGHHSRYYEPASILPPREPYDGYSGDAFNPPWPHLYVFLGGEKWALVDRRHKDNSKVMLPRLGLELNEIEWRELPIYYRLLYGEHPDKGHVLLNEYREHWGKNR